MWDDLPADTRKLGQEEGPIPSHRKQSGRLAATLSSMLSRLPLPQEAQLLLVAFMLELVCPAYSCVCPCRRRVCWALGPWMPTVALAEGLKSPSEPGSE